MTRNIWIAAGKRYELDGYEHYDFSSDRTYQKDPLCMHVSWIVCRAVAKRLDGIHDGNSSIQGFDNHYRLLPVGGFVNLKFSTRW